MSDDIRVVRAIALSEAIKYVSTESTENTKPEEIIDVAKTFLAFLNGADAPTSTSAKTSPSTAPVTKASPPKTAAPAPGPSSTASKKPAIPSKSAVEPETTESDAPTAEDVGKKINELLAADKQPEALTALKKYGAKSKSTLPVEHYGDFIADADKILMDA